MAWKSHLRSVLGMVSGAILMLGSIVIFAAWQASAEPGAAESSFVSVTPVRILDTRDPVNLGLAGPFVSATPQDLRVTGTVATTAGSSVVVPMGATGVVLNVTVVEPGAAGFVSVRPADAPGVPKTSSLNFAAGETTPNAVSVSLPTAGTAAGKIEITYDAYGTSGPTADMLVDVVGYYTTSALDDLDARLTTLEESSVPAELEARIAELETANEELRDDLDAKADRADVNEVLLRDWVWVALINPNGDKGFTGPFTSTRTDTGRYSLQWNVAGLGIPYEGGVPLPAITPSCTGYTASWSVLVSVGVAGTLTQFSVAVEVVDPAGALADCGFTLLAKFNDPNTILDPLPEPSDLSGDVVIPPTANCVTEGDQTTCTATR